jgi:hypothetical protein
MNASAWTYRLVALVFLVFTASAAALPAHYVVFTKGADDRVRPVFYAQVDLVQAPASQSGEAVARGLADEERIVYHAWRGGMDLGEESVGVPILRGEFAHDPEHGDDSIDAHHVANANRSFVLRIPLQHADAVEFAHGATLQRFDLAELAAQAHMLASDIRVPSLQIERASSSGNPANRVDMLVIGDGYTSAQQALFASDALILHDAFFGLTPYREYESFVNWTTGFAASSQAGADHPPYQADCTQTTCCSDSDANGDPLSGQYVDTAFDATFCAFQIQRLLVVDNVSVLAAAAAYPDWDKILIVVNDATYGGSGGDISVTSTHAQANQIVLHEYGHSFSHLADEYSSAYPGFPPCSDLSGSAPCEANVTNRTTAAQVKWASWFTPGNPIPTPPGHAGVGLFEGARYLTSGMYRPADTQCLMQYLGQPFCPVCRQEYVRTLYRGGFGVPGGGIDLIEPGSESPSPAQPIDYAIGTDRLFEAILLQPTIGSLGVQWYLDGSPIAGATSPSYTFSQATATPAVRTLELRVKDLTPFVSPTMAGTLLDHTRTWTVQISDTIFDDGFD